LNEFCYEATDLVATTRLGKALAESLPPGATVALCGTLGAGKTFLVKAVAVASGVPAEDVLSPTFVLCREYQGRRTLYHLDAYRIQDDDEFLELGPEEYFESEGVTFVEWADRVEGCLPPDRVEVHIESMGSNSRRFRIRAVGERPEQVVEALRARLATG
jgi:tRNA threonylcarbamoyladenosine biosynthesis protein TsaE